MTNFETRGYHLDQAGETNDCTVRATARGFVVTYQDAHAALAECGRRPRKGIRFDKHVHALAARFKQKVIEIPPPCRPRTVARVLQCLDPSKRYLVAIRGHVFAVCYGRVAGDWIGENRRHRVHKVWEVTR